MGQLVIALCLLRTTPHHNCFHGLNSYRQCEKQASVSPLGPQEIFVRIQLTLRNLRNHVADLPLQPHSPLDSSAQHHTTPHHTTPHHTTPHNTTQHNTTQHNTTQHHTSQHITTQHNTTHHTTHSTTPTWQLDRDKVQTIILCIFGRQFDGPLLDYDDSVRWIDSAKFDSERINSDADVENRRLLHTCSLRQEHVWRPFRKFHNQIFRKFHNQIFATTMSSISSIGGSALLQKYSYSWPS